jgi:hypothetical protein
MAEETIIRPTVTWLKTIAVWGVILLAARWLGNPRRPYIQIMVPIACAALILSSAGCLARILDRNLRIACGLASFVAIVVCIVFFPERAEWWLWIVLLAIFALMNPPEPGMTMREAWRALRDSKKREQERARAIIAEHVHAATRGQIPTNNHPQ